MPIPIILAILAAAAALVVVVVAVLYYDDIIKWFQERHKIKESDKNNIAFTLKEKLKSGNYKIIQGVFNKNTDEIIDGQIIEAEQLDSKIQEAHKEDDLVLYS